MRCPPRRRPRRTIALALALCSVAAAGGHAQPATAEQRVRTLVQASYKNGDLAALDSLVEQEFVSNDERIGREGFRSRIDELRVAFPDLDVAILAVISAPDRVAARLRFSGTHRGTYMGFPATNRRVRWTVLAWFELGQSGKLARRWAHGRENELASQLSP